MAAATSEQHDAYKTHQSQRQSDREIEARALLSCASLLSAAKEGSDQKLYTDALKRNQRLWTFFQVALCDPDNPLPRELKIILLNLSRYIDKVSFRAIAEYTPALLANLIDINRHVATGLNAKSKIDDQVPPPPEPPGRPIMTTA
jgi:flagellar biosynthesis activator protein FlaF